MIITRKKYLDMLVAGQGNGLVKAALAYVPKPEKLSGRLSNW